MSAGAAGGGRSPRPVTAYLGLGSNVGDKAANLQKALRRLSRLPATERVAVSQAYRTEPVGRTDQDWFLNMVVALRTSLLPGSLLLRCLRLEAAMGRVRTVRWGPRTIDIDVLLYDDVFLRTEDLEIPHPRMTERAFVLAPLAELAPELIVAGKPVQVWLQAADQSGVRPFGRLDADDGP